MTLRLILVRHAKSDWGNPGLADHDRLLNVRGRRSTSAIGAWLAEHGHVPKSALLSTAVRVEQTWQGLAAALGHDISVTRDRRLYLSSPETMLDALTFQSADRVMLIAHNPGMASLAQWLVEKPPQRSEFDRFPTCATLVLDFTATKWDAIQPMTGQVVDFVVPRDLIN